MTTPLINSDQLIEKNEAEIIIEALDGRAPASDETLGWLNENVPPDFKLKNRQSIYDWTIGKYNPSHFYLNVLNIFYAEGDPRRDMAEKLIQKRRAAVQAHWIGEAS
jgi:hypothetical protein